MASIPAAEAQAEAGAPETEIEITPAMIEAGAREVKFYVPGYDFPNEVAEAVFEAMMEVWAESNAFLGWSPKVSK